MRGGFGALAYGIGWIGGFAGGDHDLLTGVSADDHHAQILEATQAQMEAETASAIYVPPDLVKNSPGVAKVYCGIALAGTLNAGSYNVASVTDTGLGDRTIVIATDFSNTDYVPLSNIMLVLASVNEYWSSFDTLAVGSVRHTIENQNDANDDIATSVVMFGDQ